MRGRATRCVSKHRAGNTPELSALMILSYGLLQRVPASHSQSAGALARYNECMESRPQSYEQLIAQARHEFGVALEVVNTGGGFEAMHARLETGHWLVVTDAEDALSHIDDRLSADADGRPLGWFAGIYENDTSAGSDWPASSRSDGCIDYEQHDEAKFDELNEVIKELLGRIALRLRAR